MATRGDAPSRRLIRWIWAATAAWIAALAWDAALDNTDVGDPPASIGHELAADLPLAVAAAAFLAIGVLGLYGDRRARRTAAAFALLVLGGVAQLGGVVWLFVEDVTTAHHDRGDGLVIAGLAASVVAVVWLTVRWWRRDRTESAPVGRADRLRQRWGAATYLAVFGSLTVLALLPIAMSPDVPNALALTIVCCATLAWVCARVVAAVPSASGPAPGVVRPERPGDPATREYLAPAGRGRIARSWRLTCTAFDVLRHDRTLLALAGLSILVTTVASVAILWAAGWFAHPGHERTLFWLWLATAWPLSCVGTFFNVALVAAAAAAFDGRRLSLREALAASVRRLGPIAFWSLLASTVGALLRVLAERLPLGGRLASVVLGASWSVLTLLAVPVLALEGCSAVDCLRRSTELVKRRWGEGISGAVIISAWVVVATLPAGLLLGFAVQMDGAARSVLLAIAIAGLMVIAGANGALRQVFALALYRYASSGAAPAAFSAEDLEHPFAGRRGWWRR